ncbi:MAG: pyridoxamine 5'-phosphate oxidase family protein [Ardenticatenaceae bacterium]|nr:pyridoxamine 5'-phosphate oxidase family protein [Ardenticatenaceae bacterium]
MKEYTQLANTEVRRADRAVTDEAWIRTLLHRAPVGVLAFNQGDQPFLNSNLYVYDEAAHAIYMHTARVGRTPANLASETKICFTIFEMGRLLPAKEALEFSVEYSGVTVFGTAVTVEDPSKPNTACNCCWTNTPRTSNQTRIIAALPQKR